MIAGNNIFSTSETAYAVDRRGRIAVWNRAAEQTFGHTESEALGRKCWELLSGRDLFGNQFCCEGCPVRVTAFNNESINRFQVDFKTADHEFKRFTVSTLMLFNTPGREVFVHLCHPETNVNECTVTNRVANHSAFNSQPNTLTRRETEVLTLLRKGMTVAKIAAALGISASTVRNHTQHILLKLHVHNQLQAVALARKFGLI